MTSPLVKTLLFLADGSTQEFDAAPVAPPPVVAPPVLIVPTPAMVPYRRYIGGDEFTGPTLNPLIWEKNLWYLKPDTAGSIPDSGGGEADWAHVGINQAGLALSASSATPLVASSWRNGMVDSAGMLDVSGGGWYVEWAAAWPHMARGYWPAIAMYADSRKVAGQPYGEFDLCEYVWPPGSSGPVAYQTWHAAGGVPGISRQIGGVGVDLTELHTYGASCDLEGLIQYFFDGQPNGAPIAGGANALESFFQTAAMATGGNPKDGWAGVPNSTTPPSCLASLRYYRQFAA